MAPATHALDEQIGGRAEVRILREFATNSALFPLFIAILTLTSHGNHGHPANWLLLASGGIQAWFLGIRTERPAWQCALGNLIAPTLYTLMELVLEGVADFLTSPEHWLLWGYALGMALLYLLDRMIPAARTLNAIITSMWRVMLFPAIYSVAELGTSEFPSISWQHLGSYWFGIGSHTFVLFAAILFGILLGLSEAQQVRYLAFLQSIAQRLKVVSEWSLDSEVLARSVQDPSAMQQRRVERVVLFMDIRGFTAWSETRAPETVIRMLNDYYELAEARIAEMHGQKPHFIADAVMTWFADAEEAIRAAHCLNTEINVLLRGYHLNAGMGLHLGPVVEGLVGSSTTRSYNIIGDTVNTASRLCAAASAQQVLISGAVAMHLSSVHELGQVYQIDAKGKQGGITAYELCPERKQLPVISHQ